MADLTDYTNHPALTRSVEGLLKLSSADLDGIIDVHQKVIDQIMEEKRQKIGKILWLRKKIEEESDSAL